MPDKTSGLIRIHTVWHWWYFWKNFSKKLILKSKNNSRWQKSMQNYPEGKETNVLKLAHITTSTENNWANTWDFQQCGILTSVYSDEHVQPPFKLRNSKWFLASSLTVIKYSRTSKGSDQTARMCRLIWGFAGCTYHTLLEIMSWLKLPFSLSRFELS